MIKSTYSVICDFCKKVIFDTDTGVVGDQWTISAPANTWQFCSTDCLTSFVNDPNLINPPPPVVDPPTDPTQP